MSRQFADWIKSLDELEPKGVTPEPRVYFAPPLRGEVKKQDWPFRILAAVCVGLVIYDLWLVFLS